MSRSRRAIGGSRISLSTTRRRKSCGVMVVKSASDERFRASRAMGATGGRSPEGSEASRWPSRGCATGDAMGLGRGRAGGGGAGLAGAGRITRLEGWGEGWGGGARNTVGLGLGVGVGAGPIRTCGLCPARRCSRRCRSSSIWAWRRAMSCSMRVAPALVVCGRAAGLGGLDSAAGSAPC